MRILAVDQSLSKCAFCEMVDGTPTKLSLSKTGASKVKCKRPDTTYYDELHDQIHHVCLDLDKVMKSFQPDIVVFEALSFGSVGDVTRNLAELMGALRETLKVNYPKIPVQTIAPTSLKSHARDYLKHGRQFDGSLKTGKPKKVNMDKKLMVEAVREIYGEDYLKGYNYSSGLDDLADATLLAHKTWIEYEKNKT